MGHAWRSQNPLLRIYIIIILEKDAPGKRPLERPRMRCGDLVEIGKRLRWRVRLEGTSFRLRWLESGVFDRMVLAAVCPKNKERK